MSSSVRGEARRGTHVVLSGLSRSGKSVRRLWIGFVPTMSALLIITATLAAVLADHVAPHDPIKQSLIDSKQPPPFKFKLEPPFVFVDDDGSTEFLLGTDFFGRDILTRLIHGARISLSIGGLVILVGATVGTLVGITAGYFGGFVDGLLMRIVDIILSLPLILVAIVLVVVLGASTANVIFVVTFLIWPRFARVIRSEALSLRQQDFILLAEIAGASTVRIMMRHILPNVMPTLLVIAATLNPRRLSERSSSSKSQQAPQ